MSPRTSIAVGTSTQAAATAEVARKGRRWAPSTTSRTIVAVAMITRPRSSEETQPRRRLAMSGTASVVCTLVRSTPAPAMRTPKPNSVP